MFATKSMSKIEWREKRADKALKRCASATTKWTATFGMNSNAKTKLSNLSMQISRHRSGASMVGLGKKRWHVHSRK